MTPLELWGGHECSVIRFQDRYADQTVLAGHQHRLSDLRLFAGLGLKKLRYPVLWERVSPDSPERHDFSWSDERLGEIRRLGMMPIVGLLHHGSGPTYTSLLDGNFPAGLAAHARAVAERYPWVEDWNPVNEPLTTARFSCLNGNWYPHLKRDEGAFWLALLHEVNGVHLAMRAIREVNPAARLIQTDDLCFTHATPPMAAQAAFENHRRWITWDLLTGRVTPGHPLWVRIASFGHHERLAAMADDPCPPDVLGINYYVPSERVLDHDVARYAPEQRGQDGPEDYVNLPAVGSVRDGPLGLAALLDQAWARYGIPMGVLETHNVGTRDEMMRWVLETWRCCEALRRDGVQIEAVTAWSLLGAFDWKTLGMVDARRYEVGIFDLKGGEPRPTALAPLLQALAAGREPPVSPALASPGWWRRDLRFRLNVQNGELRVLSELIEPGPHRPAVEPPLVPCPPILITGRTGTLGQALIKACEQRALPYVATDRGQLRLEDRDSIMAALDDVRPWAVVNAAGWTSIDGAEEHRQRCMEANALGPENLALACKRRDIPLVTVSSDMVFDGTKGEPYVETDAPNPLNTYGRSKAEGERRVLAAGGKTLIVRSATYFSPDDSDNFAVRLLNDLADGTAVSQASDRFMSPTHVPDLADGLLDLLIDGETGIWHLTSSTRMSWADFARALGERAGWDPGAIRAVPAAEMGWRAERLADVTLGSLRGGLLPDADAAMDRFVATTQRASKRAAPKPAPTAQDPVLTGVSG